MDKTQYQSPRIIRLGAIHELTQCDMGAAGDADVDPAISPGDPTSGNQGSECDDGGGGVGVLS